MIRKYKKYKDYFFRLTLTSENLDKVHFGPTTMKSVLDFMIGVLGRGVQVGGTESQIVNYSNSQLKNHSVWMLVKTEIEEI